MKEVTGKLSDVTRQLLLAGVAVSWLFAVDGATPVRGTDLGPLRLPLGLFLAGLLLDFAQYAIRAFGVRSTYERMNRKYLGRRDALAAEGKDYLDEPVDFPSWIPRWTMRCFRIKCICVALGYLALIIVLPVDL